MTVSAQTKARSPLTGQDASFYCKKEQVDYFYDRGGGVIFMGAMPSVEKMAAYANDHYKTGVYQDYVKAKPLKILTAHVRLDQIAKYKPAKRLLDVGCSAGFFLEAAQTRGYEITGIDFASAAIAQADPGVRPKLVHGDVNQDLSAWREKFDVVSAFDIIEHTQDPTKFVGDIKNMLVPGGLLVMSTPDIGHFLRYVMGARWSMLQPMQHTVLFSRAAMKTLLEKCGFRDVQIETTYKYLTLKYLADQLRETNPVVSRIMDAAMKLMPASWAAAPFRVNIGEFIVFARKPV